MDNAALSDADVMSHTGVIHTGSISSDVELDLAHDEAHKIYHPSWPVRLLYWLAFQARFPYIENHAALEAARLRRIIVDLLTKVWFGHHLVARVVDIADLPTGGHDFVTQLVRGHEPAPTLRAKTFLKAIDRRFLEAGLPTWQTTPYNPHAITNFIEKSDGTFRIIDLESSLVAFLYPVSRVVGLIRIGQFPSFDDIDMARLRSYIASHSDEIDSALPLGERGMLDRAVEDYAIQQEAWHRGERRYLPRTLRFALRLIDAPSWIRGIKRLAGRGQRRSESFVREGLVSWVRDGRITQQEAEEALAQLNAPPVAYAMFHLGVHFAISVPLRFPFGALSRCIYTIALRVRAEAASLLRGTPVGTARETHTLAVALLALVPGFGRLAYLLAKPLRSNRLLILVPFDVVAKRLPGRAYERLHLGALLDYWAHPIAQDQVTAATRREAIAARLRTLAPRRSLIAVVAGLNLAVFVVGACLYLSSGGSSTWWFAERGVMQTIDTIQLWLGGVFGLLAVQAFWRGRHSTADSAGIFLWGLLGIGLMVFAIDDYMTIHEGIGAHVASHYTGGINVVNDIVVISYAVLGAALLHVFRHELLAFRASSALLLMAVACAAIMIVSDLAADVGPAIPLEFPAQMLAAGFLLLATYVRYCEVRVHESEAGGTRTFRVGALPLNAANGLAVVARLIGAVVAAVFVYLAIRIGPPTSPDPSSIEDDVQYVFVVVGVFSVGLSYFRPAWGGWLMALTGAVLGAAAAGYYSPERSLTAALLFVVPGTLFVISSVAQYDGLRRILAAVSLTALMIAGGDVALARHDHAFGPSHPSSALSGSPVDLIEWAWSGAVTYDSATINAQVVRGGRAARVAYSENSELRDALFTESATIADASAPVVSLQIQGLRPNTIYYYAVEVDGRLDTSRRGSFHTFPQGPATFTFAFSSCARLGSNGAVFDAIRDAHPLLYVANGDFHYGNIDSDSPESFRNAYDKQLEAPSQSELYRNVPIAYIWDDHDFGGNNADAQSASKLAAEGVYREVVPHYALQAGIGPIHQAFDVGDVRFLLTDLRSERNSQGPGEHKTMLGQSQLAWLKQELLNASRSRALVVWVSSVPWIGSGSDGWGGYENERREIADFITANDINNLLMLGGDAHMVAIDDGSHAEGGFPVMHAGALDRPGSKKGGPYSEGAVPGAGQFGLVTVLDDGGPTVRVELSGRNYKGEEILAYGFTVRRR